MIESDRKGFILVLVTAGAKAAATGGTVIARVCRDYDVESVDEVCGLIETAARQAGNQLTLRQRAVARARSG